MENPRRRIKEETSCLEGKLGS